VYWQVIRLHSLLYVGSGSIQPTFNLAGKICKDQLQICGEKHETLGIHTVIHIDVPYSPEAYLQETGRAGRDGTPVEAVLLYSEEDLAFADVLST
jgi:hypothetical protein